MLDNLARRVKEKNELRDISDSVIIESLRKVLRNLGLKEENLPSLAKSDEKLIIKETRSILRKLSGQFRHSLKDRLSLLRQGKINELLETHSSTRERIRFYPKLRKLIRGLKMNSIIDLGCGLNPIALCSRGIHYLALDINESDINIVNEFFRKNKINGNALIYNLRDIKNDLPKADLCVVFKLFDVLEEKGHKLAEKIILSIKAKYFLISFSTKTLSGKPMNHPQRGWIEKLFHRLGFKFKIITSSNEVFYLASAQE